MSRGKAARAPRCPACSHPAHPKGVCTTTQKGGPLLNPGHGSTHNWQCGCAYGMRYRPQGKPRYVPEGR